MIALIGGLVVGLVLADYDLASQDLGLLTLGLCFMVMGSVDYGKRQ